MTEESQTIKWDKKTFQKLFIANLIIGGLVFLTGHLLFSKLSNNYFWKSLRTKFYQLPTIEDY